MLLVINGVEDSELAPDLGHVFLTHSCGSMCVDWGYMGSVWMRVIGTRGGWMLLTRAGPGSWLLLHPSPHWPCIRGLGSCHLCIPHVFLTPHQPGRVRLKKGV